MNDKLNMDELYNSRIINTYIKFLQKHHNFMEDDINNLLSYSKIRREDIANPAKWFSQIQINDFMDGVSQAVRNADINDIAYEAGVFAATPEASGLMRRLFIGFMGPERAYSVIGKYTEKFYSRSAVYESEKLGAKRYRITVTPEEGVNEKPFQCFNRMGYLKAISKLFNKNANILDHKVCCCPLEGARSASCIYEIVWDKSANDLKTEGNIEEYKKRIKELEKIIEEQHDSTETLLEQIQSNFETSKLIRDIGHKIEAVTSIEDLHFALETLPELIVKRLNYLRCAIFLANRNRDFLIFRVGYGFEPKEAGKIHRYRIRLDDEKNGSILLNVFRNQEPQVINGLEEIESLIPAEESELYETIKMKKFAVCPISYKNLTLGVLYADNPKTERNLDQSDVNLLMAVVPQIGFVIDEYFEKIEVIRTRLERRAKDIPAPVESGAETAPDTDIRKTSIDSIVTFFDVLKNILGTPPEISEHLEKELENLTLQQKEMAQEQTRKELMRRALHSIQNPAWNILNSIEWMKDEFTSSEFLEELQRMEENIERIRGVSKNFSRYLKPLAKRLESFDLLELINSVAFRNETKNRTIYKSFPDNPLIINADRLEIEWAIEELIQNAFKYGADKIVIKILTDNRSVSISFEDNGFGIKKENINDLFTPFKLAGDKGTGLGLANAKRIMEAHHGGCYYIGPKTDHDAAQKPGTVFLIRLPLNMGGYYE